jgi:hypothetical protein
MIRTVINTIFIVKNILFILVGILLLGSLGGISYAFLLGSFIRSQEALVVINIV